MALETESKTDATEASGNGGAAAPTQESFEVHNPATGELIRTLPIDGRDRVKEVVAGVRAAQPEWETLGNKGRAKQLGVLREWLLDNQEEISDRMQEETGKVRGEAGGEAVYLTDLINFYGKKAKKYIGEEKVSAHSPPLKMKRLRVQYRPYPVVGVISPWNFPLILSLGDALPALQAGAAAVIKPSEITPLTLGWVVEAWKNEIGGPDVLEVVNGLGECGGALVDEVDFVQFSGSDRTGRKVMARAAESLTPVSLELGGKDPMIVLDGADIERAVNAATWGAFGNTGQICMSVERLYVEEPVYDEFMKRFVDEVGKLKQGMDGREYGSDIGAMTFPKQMETIEDHVGEAKQRGANVLTGGERKDGPGDWYPPTIITGVDHSMKVMRDETFGPVVGVMKVGDAEEAVQLANDSRYGLSGAVFGRRRDAERVARRLEAGAINVNDVLVNYLASDVPMGGWKESGIGFRHGQYGIKKFVRPESLVITRLGGKRELIYFPYTQKRRNLLSKASRLLNARGLRNRLKR
ncbi:MAG: aldehyde dehydrogenase family protein [Solirubrobacterales bacterium]